MSLYIIEYLIAFSGGILVFLTGAEEIESVVRQCRNLVKQLPSNVSNKIRFFPLYSALTQFSQMKVFEPVPSVINSWLNGYYSQYGISFMHSTYNLGVSGHSQSDCRHEHSRDLNHHSWCLSCY